MKQLKTMGSSALLLLILCLSPTNGFLETNRKFISERNIETRNFDQSNDRNFFGNTWQRSYGTSESRRIRENSRLIRLLPQENSRQLINDRRQDVLKSPFERDQRRLLTSRDDRESRVDNSFDRRDNRVISPERSRAVDSSRLDDTRREIRSINIRENNNENRRLSNLNERQQTRDNEQNRRVLLERREVTPFSRDRASDVSAARDRRIVLTRENSRESQPQLRENRREIRSTTDERSRLNDNNRQVSRNRENAISQVNNRRREVRTVSENRQVREENREARQLSRREVRSTSTDRARIFETERRQMSHERDNERRDIRSVSVDRQIRENDRESRQLNRRVSFDRKTRENNRVIRQLVKREVRSISSNRATERRQLSRNRDGERSQVVDRTREIRLTLRQIRENDLESRQINRRVFLNRDMRENYRESPLEMPSISSDRIINNERQLSRNRDSERRDIQSISQSRRIRENDRDFRQLNRQLSENQANELSREGEDRLSRREIRSISNNRQIRENDRESRQLNRRLSVNRENEDSRQLIGREVRSFSADRSRVINSERQPSREREEERFSPREVRLISRNRQIRDNDRESRQERRETRLNAQTDSASRRVVSSERREDRSFSQNRDTIRERRAVASREERRITTDRSRQISSTRDDERRTRQVDAATRREIREVRDRDSRQLLDREIPEIKVLERRLTREVDRRASDATRRIVTLSSKDENNNRRYFARVERQSTPAERRMATSFNADVSYLPEVKSSALFNALQVMLLTFLVAQVVSNSSKARKNWFFDLTNFVTVTKEKVL